MVLVPRVTTSLDGRQLLWVRTGFKEKLMAQPHVWNRQGRPLEQTRILLHPGGGYRGWKIMPRMVFLHLTQLTLRTILSLRTHQPRLIILI